MKESTDRRAFLQGLAVGAAAIGLPPITLAQTQPRNKMTYTYKTVGSCAIKADVYALSLIHI